MSDAGQKAVVIGDSRSYGVRPLPWVNRKERRAMIAKARKRPPIPIDAYDPIGMVEYPKGTFNETGPDGRAKVYIPDGAEFSVSIGGQFYKKRPGQ
jgi:hypothetical protein